GSARPDRATGGAPPRATGHARHARATRATRLAAFVGRRPDRLHGAAARAVEPSRSPTAGEPTTWRDPRRGGLAPRPNRPRQPAGTRRAPSPAGPPRPPPIRGFLAARLDALPDAERALLLDAAVVGKTFWRGALSQVGVAEGLSELLGALERRDLIVRDTSSI